MSLFPSFSVSFDSHEPSSLSSAHSLHLDNICKPGSASSQGNSSLERLEEQRSPYLSIDNILLDTSRVSIIREPGPPPDGGWNAWLQVFLSHICTINSWGFLNSYGVRYFYLTRSNVISSRFYRFFKTTTSRRFSEVPRTFHGLDHSKFGFYSPLAYLQAVL